MLGFDNLNMEKVMEKQKGLNYAVLAKQIELLTAKAEELRAKEAREAAEKVKELVKVYGLTAADIGIADQKAKLSRGKYRELYRDPATGVGWAGRGRVPKWMVPHLAQGKTKEDFRVKG